MTDGYKQTPGINCQLLYFKKLGLIATGKSVRMFNVISFYIIIKSAFSKHGTVQWLLFGLNESSDVLARAVGDYCSPKKFVNKIVLIMQNPDQKDLF